MSSTDNDRTRTLAGGLFDEILIPLGEQRNLAGRKEYFPLAGESGVNSYYEEPICRVMEPTDFEFPGGGTVEGLLDALAVSWTAAGETGLAETVPRLKEIAEALREKAAEQDGSISILCYTMF